MKGPASEHGFEYIIRTSGGGGADDQLPMVIALHGHGDTPDNFFQTLLNDFDYPARFIVLRGPEDYAGGKLGGRAWPIDNGSLQEYGSALADAVPVLLERFPTGGKPAVVGFSGGAYYAYYLAAFHADQFSYIFPLSGGLPGELLATDGRVDNSGVEVIAFHGRQDGVIGFQQGKAAVDNLQRRGVSAVFVPFDGGHLDIFRSVNGRFLDVLGDSLRRVSE